MEKFYVSFFYSSRFFLHKYCVDFEDTDTLSILMAEVNSITDAREALRRTTQPHGSYLRRLYLSWREARLTARLKRTQQKLRTRAVQSLTRAYGCSTIRRLEHDAGVIPPIHMKVAVAELLTAIKDAPTVHISALGLNIRGEC